MHFRVRKLALPRTAVQLLYRSFMLMTALWLAVFAPAMCQYHGLLLHFGSAAHNSHLPDAAFADRLCGDVTPYPDHQSAHDEVAGRPPAGNSPYGLYGHTTTSSSTTIMSLLVVARPTGLSLRQAPAANSITPPDMRLPQLPGVAPLLRPPRLL